MGAIIALFIIGIVAMAIGIIEAGGSTKNGYLTFLFIVAWSLLLITGIISISINENSEKELQYLKNEAVAKGYAKYDFKIHVIPFEDNTYHPDQQLKSNMVRIWSWK